MTLALEETNYIDNTPPLNKWDARFREYHKENPWVYHLIKKYVKDAIDNGFSNYSIKLIFNHIRWHHNFAGMQDAYHAYYARLFMKEHPQHEGFFRTSTLRCTDHA
tara:strand:- start:8 stop:325 length:318 start_codon:yes stop_codon:yes gene_type:complete